MQIKANQAFAWFLVFLSRYHVVSDEYLPSPYFEFVEFWVTLEFIVYAFNNRRWRFGFGIEVKQTSRTFQFKKYFCRYILYSESKEQ